MRLFKWSAMFLLFACVTIANAEDSRRDGNWWRSLAERSKAPYMVGFLDGMVLGERFSYWGTADKSGVNDTVLSGGAAKSYVAMQEKYLKNVTNTQIADGLTEFYEDYRNRTIDIPSAVWLVLNMINGTPEKEMRMMIESHRKNANN
jgi:hypothetical protein